MNIINPNRIITLSLFLLITLTTPFKVTCNSNQINYRKETIGKILSFVVEDYGVKFNCLTNDKKDTVKIFVSFPFVDAAKIKIMIEDENYVNEEGEPFEFIESDDTIKLFTSILELSINKNEWKLSVIRDNKNLLTQFANIYSADGKTKIQIITGTNLQEHFYGFGEKFNGLDQRGKKVVMELNDAYMSDDDSTYKSIPFFLSSKNYGIFINSSKRVFFNMGSIKETEYDFENPFNSLEYFIFTNKNPLEVMTQYTSISGRPPLIPKWSLEPWLSRRRMTGWNSPKNAEADIDMIINHDYRIGVVLWEGIRMMFWGNHSSDMVNLSNKWQSMGIKQITWDNTGHIHKESPLVKNYANDFFIKYSDGSFSFGGRSHANIYIDPTNSEAMQWWKKTFYEERFLSENGKSSSTAWNLDGIKLDFSELFPKDDENLLNIDKSIGMHNQHAVLFSEQIYNWLQRIKPEGGITWVRGGGIGMQKVGFSWGGDRGRTFEQLRGTVSASLGVSICGVSLIGHDLGGYRGGNSIEERKVYIRGAQYAAFSPSFHDHGSAPAPWEQNEYGNDNYSFYTRIRYNILPYLYHYVKVSHDTGIPMMRTLFMHHPEDKNTFNIEDEYYLGDDLLIAPILTNENERKVYLPKGNWIDFWNQKQFEGEKFINYKSALNRIPVFVRESSVLPLELNNEMKLGGLFSHEQKNNLLLTFRFVKGVSNKSEFYHNGNYINISKVLDSQKIIISIDNIKQKFGLILDGVKTRSIFINGKKLENLNDREFSIAYEGWKYDKDYNQLFIKINNLTDSKFNIILQQPESIATSIEDKLILDTPIVKKIFGWENSVDLCFTSIKEAELYNINYWGDDNPGNIKTIVAAQSPVTISNLLSNHKYFFTVESVNDNIRSEKSGINSITTGRKKPFFISEGGKLIINAERYISQAVKVDSTRNFTYGLIVPETEPYTVWLKVQRGHSHFLYYRWYKIGKIELEKGENQLTIPIKDNDIEPGIIFLTNNEADRPFLMEEIFSDFKESKNRISIEKILQFD